MDDTVCYKKGCRDIADYPCNQCDRWCCGDHHSLCDYCYESTCDDHSEFCEDCAGLMCGECINDHDCGEYDEED